MLCSWIASLVAIMLAAALRALPKREIVEQPVPLVAASQQRNIADKLLRINWREDL